MVKNGEPEVTLAEGDHQGLDGGGYQDVDAVVKLLVIDDIKGPKVRDLEACPPRVSPPRSHVSTLYSCSPVLLYNLATVDSRGHMPAQQRNVAARRSLDCFHEPERV
jgi:hypothetical protein